MARRICALAALAAARAYDWTTPDAGLTPFNCTAYPNPIQVLLADGQSPPYNVSELDLATGEYTKICPNGFPTTKKVNGFALMQYPATGPQGPALADNGCERRGHRGRPGRAPRALRRRLIYIDVEGRFSRDEPERRQRVPGPPRARLSYGRADGRADGRAFVDADGDTVAGADGHAHREPVAGADDVDDD